jgi:hemin uptake protein HemP
MNEQATASNKVENVVWKSSEVLKGSTDVVIDHEGSAYHLKLTKNNRLILTK